MLNCSFLVAGFENLLVQNGLVWHKTYSLLGIRSSLWMKSLQFQPHALLEIVTHTSIGKSYRTCEKMDSWHQPPTTDFPVPTTTARFGSQDALLTREIDEM